MAIERTVNFEVIIKGYFTYESEKPQSKVDEIKDFLDEFTDYPGALLSSCDDWTISSHTLTIDDVELED